MQYSASTYYCILMITSPGWCDSVGRALSHQPKGCWSESQSGHVPELWARSLVGGVQEATNPCFSHTSVFLYLYLSLPSPLSKDK